MFGWLTLIVGPGAYALFRHKLVSSASGDLLGVEIGKESDWKVGSGRIVRFGVEKVMVARTSDGKLHALSAECTHMGCSIRFIEESGKSEFACNCHDSRFDLDGKNISGPAPKPLGRYSLEKSGDVLVLRKARIEGG